MKVQALTSVIQKEDELLKSLNIPVKEETNEFEFTEFHIRPEDVSTAMIDTNPIHGKLMILTFFSMDVSMSCKHDEEIIKKIFSE